VDVESLSVPRGRRNATRNGVAVLLFGLGVGVGGLTGSLIVIVATLAMVHGMNNDDECRPLRLLVVLIAAPFAIAALGPPIPASLVSIAAAAACLRGSNWSLRRGNPRVRWPVVPLIAFSIAAGIAAGLIAAWGRTRPGMIMVTSTVLGWRL
jgi:hypothetical protein